MLHTLATTVQPTVQYHSSSSLEPRATRRRRKRGGRSTVATPAQSGESGHLSASVQSLVDTYHIPTQQTPPEPYRLVDRTVCYALATLHDKNTPIDPIKNLLEKTLSTSTKVDTNNVYEILRIGRKWIAIIDQFGSITSEITGSEFCPNKYTGLLSLLDCMSRWERAKTLDRKAAFEHLLEVSSLYAETRKCTPAVDKIVQDIRSNHESIVDTSWRPHRTSQMSRIVPSFQTMHTKAHTSQDCITASARAVQDLSTTQEADANLLLILLCFLSSSDKIPMDLLVAGASCRKRWTSKGEIATSDARNSGLVAELCMLLSDLSTLRPALDHLVKLSMVLKLENSCYMVKPFVQKTVLQMIPRMCWAFWKDQALIVTYRAIPWKYLESMPSDIKPFLAHLEYVLLSIQQQSEQLPADTKLDLILTLIEAIRFPNMRWKRFALSQAEAYAVGSDNHLARLGIAYSHALLNRLSKGAVKRTSYQGKTGCDSRTHAALGQAIIQDALDDMQVENFKSATHRLEGWTPLAETPSPIEAVVVSRKAMLLGRMWRWRADFLKAVMHLRISLQTAREQSNLVFDEDFSDIYCDYADSLRELRKIDDAREVLKEVSRRGVSSPRLDLCRAELDFCEENYESAEAICSQVAVREKLLRLDVLRLNIIRAKICHVRHSNDDALHFWSLALTAVQKFPQSNGHTLRIIVRSMGDTLGDYNEWKDKSLTQLVPQLESLAKPGGATTFIAGMAEWEKLIRSWGQSSL